MIKEAILIMSIEIAKGNSGEVDGCMVSFQVLEFSEIVLEIEPE